MGSFAAAALPGIVSPTAVLLLLLSIVASNASSESTAPITTRNLLLTFRGEVDPAVIHRFNVHIKLNRHNYELEREGGGGGNRPPPPTLAIRASSLLGSEFLAVIHPPSDRSARTPLGVIAPVCERSETTTTAGEDGLGGGAVGALSEERCELPEFYRVKEGLGFHLILALSEYPLSDVDPAYRDEWGNGPPTVGASVEIYVELRDERGEGRASLEGFVGQISNMLKVVDPETEITEVPDGWTEEERIVGGGSERQRRGGGEL